MLMSMMSGMTTEVQPRIYNWTPPDIWRTVEIALYLSDSDSPVNHSAESTGGAFILARALYYLQHAVVQDRRNFAWLVMWNSVDNRLRIIVGTERIIVGTELT